MHEATSSLRERWSAAVRASPAALPILRGAGLAIVAVVFLSMSGAFGSGEAPYLQRLGYWSTTVILGAALGAIVSGWLERSGFADERPWLQGAITTVVIALPLTVVVWLVTSLWFARPVEISHLPTFLLPVLVISALMTAANYAAGGRPRRTHAAVAGSPPPRFLDRMPLKLRGAELIAVQSEDHYLRVHTDRGSDLILMRLSDAVAELEGLEGAQTHRSWWVARAAVRSATSGDGRATLDLGDGLQAPVSRTYVKALRAAGWF